ncbi:MAG TPA: Tad domain-containing protein [Candidatus Dormibacteraeota bacterium]|nr:Tad domain-containing protein [Candidatus Dormibacteraeota bacterium]
MPSTTKHSLQEGQAIVLIALLILVLFGMLGLAIDSGRGYVDRRDQQTAVDAAALASGDWYENFPTHNDLVGKVIPNAVTLYQNNLRIYTPCSQTFYNSGTTGLGFLDDQWQFQCGLYTLQVEAINTQFNGYEFSYKSSHQLPLAFIQIFGGASSITIAAQANAIVGNQRQTPALLTLNPNGPCSTLMHGNGQLTLYGDAYSNGPVCLDQNLGIAGNCYAVSGSCSAATFLCYSPVTGNPYNQNPCNPGDLQGTSYVPAPTLPDPQYLAPERGFYGGNGQSFDRGTWTEMTPGNWNNFSVSSNGCYFLDPGVYTWNGGYTSHGGFVSNELKAPGEAAYNAPGTTTVANPTFWGGGGGCDGSFTTALVPAVGQGIKHQGANNQGYWGVELTSVRYDRFPDGSMGACNTGAGCMRESAPSACQEVSEVDANNLGIAVTIVNNAPGAQYYNVYIDPNGCVPRNGTTFRDFSFFGTFLAPGWTDGGSPPATSAGVGPWSGVLTGGRNGWSCTAPAVTICNIQYNNIQQYPNNQCAFYSARAVNCWAPYYESPPQCFPNICGPNSAPQENAAMSLEYPPANGGDLANENYCMQTPMLPQGGDPNAPCSSAKVTPGAVQFYFPVGNNCVDQNGNGSTHVFSGEQYNWIVIYEASSLPGTPAGTYCSGTGQKLNGSSYTQYIGTIYSPTSGWDILGANTAPLAGQVIAWTATVTGNGNAGILFNPNYSPAPPAARLIA